MMALSKSTRYALHAAMEMARLPPDGQITAAEVAARYSIPPTVLAKVFQQLVRSGLAFGARGSGGGYRLARGPQAITVLQVMQAFQSVPPQESFLLDHDEGSAGDLPHDWRLQRLLDEVDEMARCTFASVTLETLTRSPRPAGWQKISREDAGSTRS